MRRRRPASAVDLSVLADLADLFMNGPVTCADRRGDGDDSRASGMR
jgi:hypothetical protein